VAASGEGIRTVTHMTDRLTDKTAMLWEMGIIAMQQLSLLLNNSDNNND